jgi:probable F420-dependent oxidoreductase
MNKSFRFGVVAAQATSHDSWVNTARRVEELGYSTLLMPDRTTIGSFAPFPALAVAAEATKALRIGSYVFCNEYRYPVMLARDAATLDMLSEGRFELGLGAGVGAYEAQRMGMPFENAGVRVGHLEEALQLIKQLFTEETVNYNGKYYTVTDLKGNIPAIQKPHMPILVAGGGERMLKLAAREANIIAIGSRITARGVDPNDATMEQKVAWIKEASGERFAHLELSQTVYGLEITDSKVAVSPQGPPIPKRQVSTEEAVAQLLEQRERYGFSYLQVFEGQMENFAPVVERLAGK